ncbi:MAG: hypothetical protein GWO83_00880 [Bacteroidia bacterium]|nr:hypothetical protein [Bacteroidia bacterium]
MFAKLTPFIEIARPDRGFKNAFMLPSVLLALFYRPRSSRHPSRRRLFAACVLLLVTAGAAASQSGHGNPPRYSKWWTQVEPIEGSLQNGRWKYARRNAIRLTKTLLNESWKDRELDVILAELALYRAIADANLDRREDAIWYWLTALNLNRRVADRDLTPYGVAAMSLSEVPLRKPGEIPSVFLKGASRSDGPVTPPGFPNVTVPTLLNNTGATRQRSADFEVEVIVDEAGDLHQPVVISRHVNPVVIYACLDWLYGVPALEPARLDGQPVAATYTVMIEFLINPYGGALVITEEPD